MGLAQKYIPYYTYDDWVHWEGRWELIEGIPVAMSPMPLPEHQRVAGELLTEFNLAVRKSGCKHCKVYQPIDYKISDDTILEPDMLVVCGNITKPFLDFTPALIIEILSPSTAQKDRGIKYNYYEKEEVKYYLIADIRKKSIEIYQLLDGRYQLQEYRNHFKFYLDEDCVITPDLTNIWE